MNHTLSGDHKGSHLRSNPISRMGFPTITHCVHYELIQTRTSVRLYERAFSPDVWIFPTIMHYVLRIMNYKSHLTQIVYQFLHRNSIVQFEIFAYLLSIIVFTADSLLSTYKTTSFMTSFCTAEINVSMAL